MASRLKELVYEEVRMGEEKGEQDADAIEVGKGSEGQDDLEHDCIRLIYFFFSFSLSSFGVSGHAAP